MKKAVLNQVTLCADGSIGLQWLKLVVLDGETVASEPHRTVVDFDGDVERQIAAVFDHLSTLGYMISPEDRAAHLTRVASVDAIGRSDPIIEANRQAKIAARAAQQS